MTLLLFNVMGLDFAIDVAPVRAMLPVPPPGEKSRHVVYLHEKIALPQVPVVYRSPRALAMDTGTRRFHLVIDAPRDMPVTVPVKSLRPFPPAGAALYPEYPCLGRVAHGKAFGLGH